MMNKMCDLCISASQFFDPENQQAVIGGSSPRKRNLNTHNQFKVKKFSLKIFISQTLLE